MRRRRVRCLECGAYFELAAERPPVNVSLVVSRGRASSRGKVRLAGGETLAVGDERVFEMGEQAVGVQLTALELAGGERVERARAEDVACVWARAVDEVELRIVVQKGWRSQPRVVKVHGLYELSVGSEESLGGTGFRIKALRLRAGRTLRRDMDVAQAKDVQTVYAEPAGGRRDAGGERNGGRAGRAGRIGWGTSTDRRGGHNQSAKTGGGRSWIAGRKRGMS